MKSGILRRSIKLKREIIKTVPVIDVEDVIDHTTDEENFVDSVGATNIQID